MASQETEQTANGTATYQTPDYRTYAPVACRDRHGKGVRMTLCEGFVGGRWEAFYSVVEAR